MSDVSNDPVAEAAARAAATAHNSGAIDSQVNPADSEDENFWQTLGSRLSQEVQSALSEIGRAQIDESNANFAVATDEANAIANGLRAYANYRAQPWIGRHGVAMQVPVINTGDARSDLVALSGYELSEPNAPLTRPATNADWIDPVVDLASVGAIAAGPFLDMAGAGATAAADSSILAADTPFIILPSELRADFDTTLPIGRFIPNNNLPDVPFGIDAHQQIGQLLQDAIGSDVDLILTTAPYETGVDVEIPLISLDDVGFQFAEIKPMSAKGISSFNSQNAQALPIHWSNTNGTSRKAKSHRRHSEASDAGRRTPASHRGT